MSPLHHIGESVRGLLLEVPLGAARALFILLMAGLLCWVLSLPRSETTPQKSRPRLSENLKIWAAASLLLQILIYAIF